MSEQIPEGSGKQFGEDVADLEERPQEGTTTGTGKQFGEDVADVESEGVPAGSGKQFAPGVEGDADLDPPESGKGFAEGQAEEPLIPPD